MDMAQQAVQSALTKPVTVMNCGWHSQGECTIASIDVPWMALPHAVTPTTLSQHQPANEKLEFLSLTAVV